MISPLYGLPTYRQNKERYERSIIHVLKLYDFTFVQFESMCHKFRELTLL